MKKKSKSIQVVSGFAQYLFYKVIKFLIKNKRYRLTEKHFADIIFNPWYKKGGSEKLLLSTTPEDFAKSDKLEWKYVIKNGKVFKIKNKEEVMGVIYGKRTKIKRQI